MLEIDLSDLFLEVLVLSAFFAAIGICALLFMRLRNYSHQKPRLTAKEVIQFENLSPNPCFITDGNGVVLHRNVAAEELNPKEFASQTAQDLLSHMVAEPQSLVFRTMNRLQSEEWSSVTMATRGNKIDIGATKLKNSKIYWRIVETRFNFGNKSGEERGLSLTFGRNGAVLSIGDQLTELLGAKPRNLRDFIEWPVPKSSGFCHLRTRNGSAAFFCILKDLNIGRSEISFFELPNDGQQKDDLFDALPIPLLQLDSEGVILAVNGPGIEFTDGHDISGRKILDFFQGVGRPLSNWVADVLAEKHVDTSQFGRLRIEDKDKYVQITLCRVNLAGGARLLAVINDATELKTLEAQFVQSQKMQAIGQLAGGVAHDFNNLLTAISGHCDLLLLRHGESDPDFADLDQIRQNANRAASLVSQLLAFSRKQTLQPQPLDLEQTLSDHTHLLNRLVGEETRLTLEHGINVKKINADKRQFEQVIMNLVVNARDAMGGKGNIRIATSMRRYDRTEKRDRAMIPPGEYCVITVMDEGCGIEPDKIQRIFEPFYTSKKTGEGTGLGLSTVYGIVKQSGGFIFVNSALGIGSTFELLFPISEIQHSVQPEVIEPEEKHRSDDVGDGVVLLVEDEAPVRAFASRALKLKGFTVLEASCAEEALDLLSDDDVAVDIFVTDVVMPGIDGPTWVGEALKSRPDTKVVFVSGYAENRCDELAENIPNSIFLPKPFSLSQLTSTVARLH